MNAWCDAMARVGAGRLIAGAQKPMGEFGGWEVAGRGLWPNGLSSLVLPEVVDEGGHPLVIGEGVLALPQMNSSGMVRNLWAAMSLSGTQVDELEAAL